MGELLGIARFKFREGMVDEYKRLSRRAMDIVLEKERGTLQYDVYLNEDESEAIVIERFRDSEAALEHTANMAEISEAVLKTGSAVGEILGEPNAEIRANLASGGPVRLFTPYLSMNDRRP